MQARISYFFALDSDRKMGEVGMVPRFPNIKITLKLNLGSMLMVAIIDGLSTANFSAIY
jgi:hypothetical protein